MFALRTYAGIMLRNLYWPAVSQNWSLYDLLLIVAILAKKSMPTVGLVKILNYFLFLVKIDLADCRND